MSIKDLKDSVGNRLQIHHSYESILTFTFTGITVDVADVFSFDIGQRGNNAVYTATGVIDNAPSGIVSFAIPSTAFDAPSDKLIFQIRYTPNGGNERILFDAFMDVVDNVVPNT